MDKQNLEELQSRVERKAAWKIKKKKPAMKVSGSQVKRLSGIIKNKKI